MNHVVCYKENGSKITLLIIEGNQPSLNSGMHGFTSHCTRNYIQLKLD